MVLLAWTGPEVYLSTMKTFLYDSYDDLYKTLNHLKNIKIKSYPREKVADFCAEILIDVDRL